MQLFGLNFFSQTKKKLIGELEKALVGKKLVTIATPNPEQIMLCQTDYQLAQDLSNFNYLLPDGIGLVWASRILAFFGRTDSYLTDRIAGVDVVIDLLRLSAQKKLKVLVFGGRNYQDLSARLVKTIPALKNLQIIWTEGLKDKNLKTLAETKANKSLIESYQPTLIFVALGAPDQERWIINHQAFLEKQGVKIAMTVGGAFDMLIGRTPRAPSWLRAIGLEWLWRLIHQPWRWRRQLRLVKFVGLVVKNLTVYKY